MFIVVRTKERHDFKSAGGIRGRFGMMGVIVDKMLVVNPALIEV